MYIIGLYESDHIFLQQKARIFPPLIYSLWIVNCLSVRIPCPSVFFINNNTSFIMVILSSKCSLIPLQLFHLNGSLKIIHYRLKYITSQNNTIPVIIQIKILFKKPNIPIKIIKIQIIHLPDAPHWVDILRKEGQNCTAVWLRKLCCFIPKEKKRS